MPFSRCTTNHSGVNPIRIFLIDYGLEVARGHHYSGASVLHATAADSDTELFVLIPKQHILQDEHTLNLMPVLSYELYHDPLFAKRGVDEFITAISGRRALVELDLTSWLSDVIQRDDVALLTTPMAPEIAGFAQWYESLPNAQRPAAAVHLVLPIQYNLAPDLDWHEKIVTQLYSQSINRIEAASPSRTLILCHDNNLAKRLSGLGINVKVHPIPSQILRKSSNLAPATLRIGLVGSVRPGKGFDLALETFQRLQSEGAPFQWVIQSAPSTLDDSTKGTLAAQNVKHIEFVPTNSQYRTLLQSLSVVLLPYDPVFYSHFQSSNIFNEALGSGIPVICSATEFFVDELARIDCENLIFRPYTCEAMAHKIREIASNYSHYKTIFLKTMAHVNPNEQSSFMVAMLKNMGTSAQTLTENPLRMPV